MISFSIYKQRDQVNAEWMSRPVDSIKNQTKNQPLVLVLTSMEQSPIFAFRLKRKLFTGPIFGEAYKLLYQSYANLEVQPGFIEKTVDSLRTFINKSDYGKKIKSSLMNYLPATAELTEDKLFLRKLVEQIEKSDFPAKKLRVVKEIIEVFQKEN